MGLQFDLKTCLINSSVISWLVLFILGKVIMYAIIEAQGKQHQVSPGDLISVDRLDAEVGSVFETDKVLFVKDGETVKVGTPTVTGAKVKGEVVKHELGKKILVFKMKRRKRYRKTQGYRHQHTTIKIQSIES